jgi:hypothetical protein
MTLLHVDFLAFLGYINNDTMIQGKAFMFNIVGDIIFECILFVHPTAATFVTVPDEVEVDHKTLIDMILTKYKYEELLKHEN